VNRDQYKRTVTEDSKLGTGIEKSALGLW
jgi:hypothetical protein